MPRGSRNRLNTKFGHDICLVLVALPRPGPRARRQYWGGVLILRYTLEGDRTRALIRTATLTGYLDMAKSFGLDGALLMRDVGLDPADIVVPDRWIPAASVARLLDASATEAGQEDS